MNHQPDLYGEVSEPVEEVVDAPAKGVWAPRAAPVKGAPNLFVELRPAYAGDPMESPGEPPPWPVYRQTPEQATGRLAGFLAAGTTYRLFRAWCGHQVTVSLEQWRQDVQKWQCPYDRCAGWVQRDSERLEGETWRPRSASAPATDAGRAQDTSRAARATLIGTRSSDTEPQEPPEWLEDY